VHARRTSTNPPFEFLAVLVSKDERLFFASVVWAFDVQQPMGRVVGAIGFGQGVLEPRQ
jgi:hypothetical protein